MVKLNHIELSTSEAEMIRNTCFILDICIATFCRFTSLLLHHIATILLSLRLSFYKFIVCACSHHFYLLFAAREERVSDFSLIRNFINHLFFNVFVQLGLLKLDKIPVVTQSPAFVNLVIFLEKVSFIYAP